MDYVQFWKDLFEEGRLALPAFAALTERELSQGASVLVAYEGRLRRELPSGLPKLEVEAVSWAGRNFYRASQFVVYRDVGAETINEELFPSWSGRVDASVHYSVDVVFRYLPDLVRFAGSAAPGDPLLEHLGRWARDWPLSSVGMEGIVGVDIAAIAGHRALMSIYIDRIIATRDTSRLADKRVREAVDAALGMYPELAAGLLADCEAKEGD
ncbi:hypothetical protein Pan216_02120 [Planctomycetes bacterium Pan216]|uniref:MoxR-vWA-beta-propeller ternary system domain-containing protein n=1 Tax=Kolteria novifilia TaxID=2527975 RepID=A0A518AXE5_9BACT|nr:hypothetical protein Pan216_02120 [Planctomycetes bacterium Pan216]